MQLVSSLLSGKRQSSERKKAIVIAQNALGLQDDREIGSCLNAANMTYGNAVAVTAWSTWSNVLERALDGV